MKHLVEKLKGIERVVTNYLDDFLFIHFLRKKCEELLKAFLDICDRIKFPVSFEKTVWPVEIIEFLGVLLNGNRFMVCITEEKVNKALHEVCMITRHKKTTVQKLQQLTGTLNFLTCAIVPGRVFTRRIYSKFTSKTVGKKGQQLKPYHHIRIDKELKNDCRVWELFLTNQVEVNRPFIDFNKRSFEVKQLSFFTDASKAESLGFGCYYDKEWTFGCWEPGYIQSCDPSIAYLELFALCIGVFTWGHKQKLNNSRVIIRCDNQSVVQMVNNMTSSCQNCMYLLRMLALENLIHNRRIFAKFIDTKLNFLADSLSRMRFKKFFSLAPKGTKLQPECLPDMLWPASKIWQKTDI